MADKLISIENLNVQFNTRRGTVKAVRDLSLHIDKGETLALVGESGCGKSVTAHSINQLIPMPPGEIKSGSVIFCDRDLLKLPEKEVQALRGTQISMIFQEPMTSLNPVFKIGDQLADVFLTHQKISKKEAHAKAVELLDLVKIPSPEKRAMDYPHQLSGGMRQRVMIAMALASPEPGLMIADEPTTALDVTIQAQILDLMNDLKEKINASIIMITHDLGVIAEICDHIIVMYGGTVMEQGTERDIFYNPQNPYTVGLHKSVPKLVEGEKERLVPIEGSPPDLLHPPEGCPFSGRCPHTMEICLTERPPTFALSETHSSACWLLHKDASQVENYEKAGGDHE
jgi:oligopeptide transport system ATP-binding protein